MTIAPLKVLMLGWDAPAGAEATPATTAALVSALAPHAALTLLLPHLPEPMHLPAPATATGLGNLTAEELALADTHFNAPHPETWQSPMAPYLGATVGTEATGPATPAAPYIGSSEAAPAAALGPDAAAEPASADTAQTAETATLLNADAFAADEAEPDAQEAAALDFTELAGAEPETADQEGAPYSETLAPTAPVAAIQPAPAAALVGPQSVLTVALEALRTPAVSDADLNFRVIQYARFATRLAASQEFAVIYAADWQAWLAGLELRQLTGKPLVLHVHSLAQDRNTAADRGWVLELERLALRRADLVLAASSALALRVLELHELPPQRVRRLSAAAAQDPARLAEAILAALQEVAPA
ncbi:glycosyltransferase family 4 protein [Hymenobacter yonginensis]|uniref:Glycosyltransferase family 4 protein n=1 Tax=Hymenobacter yonginensis TaxID=748197 RepID=A0ABY7PJT3_9BACT|nr:glycosyltransferase family 4 protein [Hymenobacter yonginensis]WBO83004.1 glycosyltransferase family 4 protein [Hymenobacter yonginensis]